MPFYNVKCLRCGSVEEEFHGIAEPHSSCPTCHEPRVTVMSPNPSMESEGTYNVPKDLDRLVGSKADEAREVLVERRKVKEALASMGDVVKTPEDGVYHVASRGKRDSHRTLIEKLNS